MQISYKINNNNHSVIFCKNKDESYYIKNKLKAENTDKKILVIFDSRLKKFNLRLSTGLKNKSSSIHYLKLNSSKKNKNEKLLFKILDTLIKYKFTKKSVIISCGGGVIGDISALASSLYLRGLIYYHIPTTMTSIVDSCIGGKTGINYKNIINSVGNYYHPKNVFISKNIIKFMPRREFFSGLPEVIKCGIINNKQIINLLESNTSKYFLRDYNFLSKLIFKTLKTKIKYFKDDIYENKKRLNLNFGHTFAHAIEMVIKSKKEDIIRHGEAVGIGMLCEIFYSEGKSKKFIFLSNLLKKYNLPTNINNFKKNSNNVKIKNEIYKNIFLDKKRINQFPRYIKVLNYGNSKVEEMRSNKRIKETIEKVILF